jgi:hypothetical protein
MAFVPFASWRWRKYAHEYRALSAYVHLLIPAFLHLAPADGPVNEPAQMSCVKFPRRALLSRFFGAAPYAPTGTGLFVLRRLQNHEKQYLTFRGYRNVAPSLLEALYGFGRGAQELGHLSLGFSQMVPNV